MKKLLTAILLIALVICTAVAFIACNQQNEPETPKGDNEFVITTNITDGAEVDEQEYRFTASATYGGEACEIEVTLNGVTVEGNGTYTLQLMEGENVIEISAKSGEEKESKEYKVTYTVPEIPAVFEITTDLDSAAIVNDVIVFTASATCNENPCNVAVTFNGTLLTANDDGKYSVTLSVGENVFNIIAREGDDTDEKNITIKYEGVELVTSLTDCDVTEKNYSFTASATYGEDNCELVVGINGEVVEPSGSEYKVTLEKGENTIIIKAELGRISKEFAFTINYQTTPPTISTSITDNIEIRGSRYNFEVIAFSATGANLSANAAFYIDWNADDGEENFERNYDIYEVWSDSEKTSYSIDFTIDRFSSHAENPFILKISVTDAVGETASVSYTMTYIPAEEGEGIGKVLFSIEGFTIGMGYFLAPTWVEIVEGMNGAMLLTQIIEENGWGYDYTGGIESGFYLSAITGLDVSGNEIPDGLWELVSSYGYAWDRSYDEDENDRYGLGEFSVGFASGWMYEVNGSFYNYGFSDYIPMDGDVVRVHFTLAYGADIGGSSAMGGGFGDDWLTNAPYYYGIMAKLADIIASGTDDLDLYYEAIENVAVWNVEQHIIDEYLAKLNEYYGR